MNRLTITAPAFRALAAGLAANPQRATSCTAGLSRLPDRREFLLHEVSWESAPPDRERPAVVVRSAPTVKDLPLELQGAVSRLHGRIGLALALGTGRAAGHLAGLCSTRHGAERLDELAIAGAGMPLARLHTPERKALSTPADLAIWSRTIGALGVAAWRRLTSLHFAVIGCGRTGSLVAISLARLGVRAITMIDPDTLELHNLGEMDGVAPADVGRHKTHALADFLLRRTSATAASFRAIHESVFSLPALVAIKAADLLFCCVDNAPARIGACFLAKLYLKPVIDIGTGILGAGNRENAMGADVRLVLPERCLFCFGGIAGFEQARAALLDPALNQQMTAGHADWRQQRAGSLHSLNQGAASFALRLLEEFLRGRVRDSAWLQLDIDGSGLPQLRQGNVARETDCRMCRAAARGDDGVHLLQSVLEPNDNQTRRANAVAI